MKKGMGRSGRAAKTRGTESARGLAQSKTLPPPSKALPPSPKASTFAGGYGGRDCGQDGGQGSEGGRRGANEKRYIVYLFLDSAMECARLAASGGLRPMAAREASCVLRHVRPHPNPLPRRGGESAVVVL